MTKWGSTCNHNYLYRWLPCQYFIFLMMVAWHPKHVEKVCSNKICILLHHVGVLFNRSSTLRSRWLTARDKARPILLLSCSFSEHYTGTSALSTVNPTWKCLGSNPVLHVEKPLIKSPRQSKASLVIKLLPFRPLYRVLVGRPQGRRPRGRPRRRWEYKNRSLRGGLGRHGLDWSGSVYGQVAGACECGKNFSIRKKSGQFLD